MFGAGLFDAEDEVLDVAEEGVEPGVGEVVEAAADAVGAVEGEEGFSLTEVFEDVAIVDHVEDGAADLA